MEIREDRREPGLVVAVGGRIDSNTAGLVEKALLAHAGEPRLVVDLGAVEYVSSAGLRVFLMLAKKSKAGGGKLALCGLAPGVKQVFDLAGFTPLFTIEPDAAAALVRIA